ncbi:hypothetical protein BJX76DRAFT_325793 [Aspergillus varians]
MTVSTTQGQRVQGRLPKTFFVAVGMSFLMLQLVFLANMVYFYATLFRSSSRVHALNVLYVDFDGDVIGQSVLDAYDSLQGKSFPTLQQSSIDNYRTPDDVQSAVCSGDYWGAVFASDGASSRLASALAGDPQDSNQPALTYIWNGVRYPAFSQGNMYSSLITLVQVARSTYYARNASNALQAMAPSNPASLQALLNPIITAEINLQPTIQGPRVLYNTVTLVMPILQQFFYLIALNMISAEFHALPKLGGVLANTLLRLGVSLVYTAICSLCTTGYIWAFRESWAVGGTQFALSWLAIWFYGHINFLLIDVLTAYLHMKWMPYCIVSWVILNVSSTVAPLELSPGFFRWTYALPAHEVYQVLVQIWSHGCQNRSYRTLPILFSWWIVGLVMLGFAVRHRCKIAIAMEKHEDTVEKKDQRASPSIRLKGESGISSTQGSGLLHKTTETLDGAERGRDETESIRTK